jgi:hypothetical protein
LEEISRCYTSFSTCRELGELREHRRGGGRGVGGAI